MRRRRWIVLAWPPVFVCACSLVTTVPDLSGGTASDGGADGPQACGVHVFTYDPPGAEPATVHVAGSFNGWPKSIDAGGWPLTKTPTQWTLTRAVPDGHNLYKLVVNEAQWIADPANPNHEPDGFGQSNSVLDVQCKDR